MNKKQVMAIGAAVVGLSTSSIAFSLTETLDRLSMEKVSAERVFCPYNECSLHLPDGSIEVRLRFQEENKIEQDLKILNSLNIITGAALLKSIAKPEPQCYNLVCHEEKEAKKAERRVRAAKLSELVEAAKNVRN